MKISKVDHTRTAVGVNENGPLGIVYSDPSQNAVQNPEIRVRTRIKKANMLYTVFGPTNDEMDSQRENGIAKEFNKIIKRYNNKIDPKRGEKETDKKIYKMNSDELIKDIKSVFGNYSLNESTRKEIDEALNVLIKRSLRKKETIESLNLLFEKTIKGEEFKAEEKDKIQKYVVDRIVADYSKNTLSKNTIKSIKNQNLVVQPQNKNGEFVFTQAKNRMNGKVNQGSIRISKAQEKDALNDFLDGFAVLDKQMRDKQLMKIRRLVDLYFYGIDEVVKEDFSVWERHEKTKGNDKKIIPFSRTDISTLQIKRGDSEDEKKRKNREKKIIKKSDSAKLDDMIRRWNIDRFRESFSAIDKSDNSLFFDDKNISKFFIHHIENEVERLFNSERLDDYKMHIGYVSEKVWKGIINYLSIKYISIGKSVYNYAMEELNNSSGDVNLGVIDSRYLTGISSFDYEKISAEETLQRETAVYVSFASSNLSRAVFKDGVDCDLMSTKIIDNHDKFDESKVKKRVLQFFGGESSWDGFGKTFLSEEYNEFDFLEDLKTLIYQMRNESFHFNTEKKNVDIKNPKLFSDMFAYECSKACVSEKDKFYSNNLPLFYSEKPLEKVLNKLYTKYNDRKSQVPSFEKVMKRSEFGKYLIKSGVATNFNKEDTDKLESGLYYLYKQIYYNDFLVNDMIAKGIFVDNINNKKLRRNENNKVIKADKGLEDFKKRLNEIKNYSLSEICQIIMTEYNQQNNQKKKSQKNEEIFQHYKLGLYSYLREALIIYINNNSDIYGFIKQPTIKSEGKMPNINEFLPDYSSSQYDDLIAKVSDSFELKKWYVMTRFLNPKQTNHLVGALRNYIQYVESIKRRAEETGNKIYIDCQILESVKDITKVVDMCTRICGNTSNEISDYFDDNDDYAGYLERFLDFEYKESLGSKSSMLGAFCMTKINSEEIKIYHDGTNPILNRNIVLSKLYGANSIISEAVPKVDQNMIKEYYIVADKIKEYRKSGDCKNIDEIKQLKEYQELKNRVEFRDIVEYSEILSELQGQLVNWAYLRERDLMYFQLGFHYVCLKNDSQKPEAYKMIEVPCVDGSSRMINGAILYQIVAMYTYGMNIYYRGHKKDEEYNDSENRWEAFNGSIGERIPRFALYSGYMIKGDNAKYKLSYNIYTSGLELFEVLEEHGNIVDFRNDIDHFNYYQKKDRSMLDYYSEAFDRFFTYDMKYRKNVPNTLSNILASHFLVPSFVFGTSSKKVGNKNYIEKKCAHIRFNTKNPLKPGSFTYVISEDKRVVGPARLKGYVKNVLNILYYPEVPEMELLDSSYIFKEEKKRKLLK